MDGQIAKQPTNFNVHLQAATETAVTDFTKLLSEGVIGKNPYAAHMRTKMRRNYEWHSEAFSVKESVDQLLIDQDTYRLLAEHADNIEVLYQTLDALAESQIDELVYSKNNFSEAMMRRDLFAKVVHAATDTLIEEGLMDAEDTRFDALISGYTAALGGYQELREMIHDRTEGKFDSLLEWATDEERKATPEGEEVDAEKASKRMVELYNEVVSELGISTESGAMMPAGYIYLATLARKIAIREAQNELPHERDPETIGAAAVPHMRSLLEQIATMPEPFNSVASAEPREKLLLAAHAKAFALPTDFRDLIIKSAEHASAQGEASLPRVLRVADGDLRRFHSRGRTNLEEHGIMPYDARIADRAYKHWAKQIGHELPDHQSVEDLIQEFEEDADAAVHESSCGLVHPGLILARRAYVEAMGKEIVAGLKEKGLPSRAAADQFAAVCEKYELGYESHWEMAQWCLEETGNAHGSFGQWSLARAMGDTGRDYPELTQAEREAIPVIASGMLSVACRHRGMPEAWGGHPYIPALYRRAMDYATEQHQREVGRNSPLFADRINTPSVSDTERAYVKEMSPETQEKITEAMQPILHRAVGMFADEPRPQSGLMPPPMDDPSVAAPVVDSRTLREVMEFFDAGRDKARAS